MMTQGDEGMESSGDALELLAAVMEQEEHVARAEASLHAARRKLSLLQARLGRLGRPGAVLAAVLEGEPPAARRAPTALRPEISMRARILDHLAASPSEVFTPAMLAPHVGASSRDSVRNTLLVLASKGRIDKIGPGQYRARPAVE